MHRFSKPRRELAAQAKPEAKTAAQGGPEMVASFGVRVLNVDSWNQIKKSK